MFHRRSNPAALYARFISALIRFSSRLESALPLLYLLIGIILLAHGLSAASLAQHDPGSGVAAGDDRIYEAARRLFLLVEGNFGALIMVCAGLASIIAAAFNQYRKAFSLFIVASGAFILRSLVVIFFDYK